MAAGDERRKASKDATYLQRVSTAISDLEKLGQVDLVRYIASWLHLAAEPRQVQDFCPAVLKGALYA